MKKSPKKPVVPALTRDPRVVAVIRATRDGFELTALRTSDGAVSMLAAQHFGTDDERVGKWIETQRAARAIVALPGADVIVRAVQLPPADEARLEGALQLNASAFVQGRTSDWRVASALLPRERGEGIRTGLVAEWPEDANRASMPQGLSEGPMVSFAPAIAGLAAIASVTDVPLLWVDSANGVLSVCVPTTRGLLARVIRAGGNGEDIEIAEVAQAVGEACVHAGVPGAEIPNTIERTVQAARGALSGGFGCADADLGKLSALVRDCDESSDPQWWRTHGLAVGIALAASGPAMPLTRLQWTDLSARPDRLGALINRISEPRTARRIMLAGILTLALAPLAVEGARLLLLRWKLPDLEAYVKAEELDRKKQAMYRVLGRQGASMTKTLSDIACSAPDGIEVEFINVAQSAKGQAVTVRGKARAAGGLQGTEIMLQMEKQLRESGAFEQVLRNSEAPDTRGYQEFAINATAVRPTYTVAFPEAQDFARTSMRVRRYGPPPEDVDTVASGLDARTTTTRARHHGQPNHLTRPPAPRLQRQHGQTAQSQMLRGLTMATGTANPSQAKAAAARRAARDGGSHPPARHSRRRPPPAAVPRVQQLRTPPKQRRRILSPLMPLPPMQAPLRLQAQTANPPPAEHALRAQRRAVDLPHAATLAEAVKLSHRHQS